MCFTQQLSELWCKLMFASAAFRGLLLCFSKDSDVKHWWVLTGKIGISHEPLLATRDLKAWLCTGPEQLACNLSLPTLLTADKTSPPDGLPHRLQRGATSVITDLLKASVCALNSPRQGADPKRMSLTPLKQLMGYGSEGRGVVASRSPLSKATAELLMSGNVQAYCRKDGRRLLER